MTVIALSRRTHFERAIRQLKEEKRYRVFIDLERDPERFPTAVWRPGGGEEPRDVTIWCSNDYLGMGAHPAVRQAAIGAVERHGAGAGGTRNISGTHHRIVELEEELADLHRKEAALVFTSGWVSNCGHFDHRLPAAGLPDSVRCAQSQLHDRRRATFGLRKEGLAS